jgi:hypothetical protein
MKKIQKYVFKKNERKGGVECFLVCKSYDAEKCWLNPASSLKCVLWAVISSSAVTPFDKEQTQRFLYKTKSTNFKKNFLIRGKHCGNELGVLVVSMLSNT